MDFMASDTLNICQFSKNNIRKSCERVEKHTQIRTQRQVPIYFLAMITTSRHSEVLSQRQNSSVFTRTYVILITC